MASPKIIVLYTTSRCNARCTFCLTAARRHEKPAPDMTPAVVEKLLQVFPETKTYKISGYGDPLVNPYLYDILGLLKKHRKRVVLQTNGIALNQKSPLCCVNKVNISVNAANRAEYRTKVGVDQFERIKHACRVVTRTARKPLDVTFVLDAENYSRLLEYVALSVSLDARRVGLPSCTPMERAADTVWWGDAVRKELGALLDEAERLYGHRIRITRTRRPPRLRRGYGPCRMSREMLFVDGAGLVAPCCRGDGPREEFGDLWTDGAGVFSSEAIEGFRKKVTAEGAPTKCRSCNEPVG